METRPRRKGERFLKPHPILNQVADFIEANPHLYDQQTFGEYREDELVYDVAGWIANLAGARPMSWDPRVVEYQGKRATVSQVARKILEMEPDDEILFSPRWSPLSLVQESLRLMAQGTPIIEVTDLTFLWPSSE